MNDEVKKVFSLKPMISFSSAQKLSSYLMMAKLYPIEKRFGSFKCTKKCCEGCKNINVTDSFTSSVTKNTYKINHKLNCHGKCLIYFLTCKKYVVETTEALRKRWNNYNNNARKSLRGESCMQQHLFEHFQSSGHTDFVEDVYITFIDKTTLHFYQM